VAFLTTGYWRHAAADMLPSNSQPHLTWPAALTGRSHLLPSFYFLYMHAGRTGILWHNALQPRRATYLPREPGVLRTGVYLPAVTLSETV